MHKLSNVFVFILALFTGVISAKDSTNVKPRALIMKTGAAYNIGMVDLGKRFPSFATIPFDFYYKTSTDFTYGLSWNYYVGNRVSIDSLYGGIVGKSEILFDQQGFPALIRYYMRGFALQGTVGKIFTPSPQWKYSGIEVRLGAGLMQHKIKARFDQGKLPQVEGDYANGYDRLCNGAVFSQTLNFHYLNKETVSFFAGVTFNQAFTRNRRSWDYSLMRQDNTLRKDLYLSFSGGVLIPIMLKNSKNPDYFD